MTVPVADSIATLVGEDPRTLDDDGLKDHLRDLVRAQSQLDAAVLAAVVEFDQRTLSVSDGQLDTRAWLAHQTGTARKIAGATVWLAKRIRYMPAFAAAMAAGRITSQHARVMATAINPRTLDRFVADEAMLVGHATDARGRRLRACGRPLGVPGRPRRSRPKRREAERAARFAAARRPPPGRRRPRPGRQRRVPGRARSPLRRDLAGRPLRHRHRRRTQPHPFQRYAAAAVDMARRSSAASDTGPGPRKPQFIVIVDVPALNGDPAGLAELEDGTPVSQSLLSEWLCDCTVARVVLAGRSLVLDAGHLIYTPSPGQRRALIARDRGCIVPGCRRKPAGAKPTTSSPGPTDPPTSTTSRCSATATTNTSTAASSPSPKATSPEPSSSPDPTAHPSTNDHHPTGSWHEKPKRVPAGGIALVTSRRGFRSES